MTVRQSIADLKYVTKRFDSMTAADSVSFSLQAGEVVGFVGANGAGKTTTISMMMGFIGPNDGVTKLFSESVSPGSAHASHRRVGYAAGDMELPAQLTGRQYIDFILHQSEGDHTKAYEALVARFSPQLDKKFHSLSRGNKQKIALVAAFLTEPELVILDEPTSGLDPHMQEVFLELVREQSRAGTTIFMSSHYLNEVADVCTRVILMREGEIIEDVSAKEMLRQSGKTVRIVTAYKATRPPQKATDVEITTDDGMATISFVYGDDVAELQRWLAGVKQLKDIEVSEYNLEGAFKSMYKTEEKLS